MNTYQGTVIQIIGPVVDVRFDAYMPRQNELLSVATESGTVAIEVHSHREGNVVRAEIAKGTDITNKEMHNMALDAAKRSKFTPDPTAPEEQKGTITYNFVINH